MEGDVCNPTDLGHFQKQLSEVVVSYQQLPLGEQPAAAQLLHQSLAPLLTCSPPEQQDQPECLPAPVEPSVLDVAACPGEPRPAPDGDAELPWSVATEPEPPPPATPAPCPTPAQPSTQDEEAAAAGKRRGRCEFRCPVPECGRQCRHRKALVMHVKWEHELGAVSCRACRQQLATHAYFLYHKRTCFQGVSALVCPECGSRFHMELPYRRHLAGHALNACGRCGERLSSRKALVKHLRLQHGIRECEKWFSCDKCPKRFMKKRSWLMHTKVHKTAEDAVCPRCQLTVPSSELEQHLSQEHGREPYSCAACGRRFRRRQQYLQHQRLHERYTCQQCSRPLASAAELAEHRAEEHGAAAPVRCELCPETFSSREQLSVHLNSHPDGLQQCWRCEAKLPSVPALHAHLKRAACARPPHLICHQCGAGFSGSRLLRQHLARAHGEGAAGRCPHCDYTNHSATNLRRHVEAHRQLVRRFVCDQCAAAFHTLSTLKDHQLYVHSTEKTHTCNECQKSFKTSSSLNRHMRIHSDTRPYECFCGHSYKRMSHLRRHLTVVHNVRPRTRLIERVPAAGDAGSDPAGDAASAPPQQCVEADDGDADQPAYLADESALLRVYSVAEEDLTEFTLPQGVYSTDTVLLPDGSRSIVLKPAGELTQLEPTPATLPPPSTIQSHH